MSALPFELEACPSECGKHCGASLDACPYFPALPQQLQKMCSNNLHMLQYIRTLTRADIGIPEYYEELTRSMGSIKNRNLLYQISEDVFVHILSNPDGARDYYVPVEPCSFERLDGLLEKVEKNLSEYVEELERITKTAERVEAIMNIMDRMVVIRNGRKPERPEKKLGGIKYLIGNGGGNGKITVTPIQNNALRYLLRRKLEGLGLLQPLISDPNIEDISCSGLGTIFIEHKIFNSLITAVEFEHHEDLDKFVIQLAEGIKHPVTFRNPLVDATLPDGSRINIAYGTDVSKRGSNFTIRKFTGIPLSIIELIQMGTLDYNMAAYLSLVLQDGMNAWVSGETASGKTTLMNALTTFIPPDAKIVSIEDTPEVQVPHRNWIRAATRGGSKGSEASEVSMFDLLKAALRQRPNLIIVGEIRGVEGAIAFQAMQTGHACTSTFHAASVTKLIQRLTGNPINVPKSYVDNLNVVIICQMVRLPNGKAGRRVTSINEIVAYDSIADSFSFIEVFTWNPITDSFDFRGYQNSYLLEEKIAAKRGIPYDQRRQIYSQIKQRTEVLKRLTDQKITNFFSIYDVLSKAYREGYFR
jgi:archaeal flagellar protein FlaI